MTTFRFQMTCKRGKQGAFTTATRAHDAEHFSTFDRKLNVIENGFIGAKIVF